MGGRTWKRGFDEVGSDQLLTQARHLHAGRLLEPRRTEGRKVRRRASRERAALLDCGCVTGKQPRLITRVKRRNHKLTGHALHHHPDPTGQAAIASARISGCATEPAACLDPGPLPPRTDREKPRVRRQRDGPCLSHPARTASALLTARKPRASALPAGRRVPRSKRGSSVDDAVS